MKHRLIAIGWTGDLNCYLDVDRETALARWEAQFQNEYSEGPGAPPITEFEFDDEFYAYQIWPLV